MWWLACSGQENRLVLTEEQWWEQVLNLSGGLSTVLCPHSVPVFLIQLIKLSLNVLGFQEKHLNQKLYSGLCFVKTWPLWLDDSASSCMIRDAVKFCRPPNFHEILTLPLSPHHPDRIPPCCKTCAIHLPTQSFPSPKTNLSYPIPSPPLLTVSLPTMYTNSNGWNVMPFRLEKQVRSSQNLWMGTSPLVQLWILTYWYLPIPNPINVQDRL